MAKGTRKPRQPRRVAVRFASRMKGRKKTLWQRRYRGSVKVRWFHRHSPGSPLTLVPKTSTLPLPGAKVLIRPRPFSWSLLSNSVVILFPQNSYPSLVFQGTKYDHEGQKTSKRNLEKENPIVRHSVEEGEEHKRTKLFSPFLCTWETEPKPKKVPKYASESKKGAESKEKISSATPEWETLEKYNLGSQ